MAKRLATDRPARRVAPLAVRLDVALRQLREAWGVPPDTKLQLDHTPALGLRPVNAAGTDYDPPQHDPRHLEYLRQEGDHDMKTTGRVGASKRLGLTGNGDQSRIAKCERIDAKKLAAAAKLLAPRAFQWKCRRCGYLTDGVRCGECGAPAPPETKGKIPARADPWGKGRKVTTRRCQGG
jgi:hypothetical protein